ncbi:hypothetical protein [Photorhabdus heterorhabditis]|nr:hypothetical protein [Photorhabdus heterorhabditis]
MCNCFYTRYLSNCLFVGCTHSPRSQCSYDIVIYAPGDSLPCRRDPS